MQNDKQFTHFIEQYNRLPKYRCGDGKNETQTMALGISLLPILLAQTEKMTTHRTVAIFKIKLK